MIDRAAFTRFLSGRLLGLAILLGFQVAIVRLLTPMEYSAYAVAIASAALVQTLTSFGIPRVIAKFVSGAGKTVSRREARTLALAMLAFRLVVCGLALGLAGLVFTVLSPQGRAAPWPLLYAGAAYTLSTTLQIDADGLAQALRLQIASRRAAVGEPLVRLLTVFGCAASTSLRADAVLWISAATSAAVAAMLIGAGLRALSEDGDPEARPARLDWLEVRRVAIGGYGGTLSWLAFSPAVIRLLAARVLPTEAFAGFSFVQTLTVSAQRYAPSFTLFPLIEPAAMADAARTGQPDRLAAVLSLLVKLDATLVGAAIISLSAAGAPVIQMLTHGRYGAAAAFLPWLLAGIVANATHRSYEIAAIGLGAAEVLTQALGLTGLWMILALATAPLLGVWPLLLCPLGDALTRFWFVQWALTRRGAPGVIDRRGLGGIVGATVLLSIAAVASVTRTHASLIGSLAVGGVWASLFLWVVASFRPIGAVEAKLLQAGPAWFAKLVAADAPQARKPFRVAVLTPRGRGGTGGVDRLMDSLRPILAERQDIQVRFVTTRGSSRWTSLFVTAAAAVRLAIGSAFRRIDMIHVNLGAHASCYRKMGLIAVPRLFGTPYVLHLHGSAFATFWAATPPFVRRRIDKLFLNAARIVVLGDVWRRLVEDRLPQARPRIVVQPNATAPIERRRDNEDVVKLLFLGDLGARKGSAVLIEALGRLRAQTPWCAVVAGDGDVAAARRQAEAFGLQDRVCVPGWVGPDEVRAGLAASDILVLPSFEENLPMSVIEAFAAGLAVIATPVGALPDILRHNETGLLVAPGDVEGLAKALRMLIDQPALRRRLGAAAKAYHAEHLALDPYADRLVQIWEGTQTGVAS